MIKLCQSVHYNPWRKPLIIQQIHPAWKKEYCTLHETKHDWNRHQTCKYVHKRIFTAIHITAIEWNSDLETATSWDPRALLLGYSCPWTVVTAWNVGWVVQDAWFHPWSESPWRCNCSRLFSCERRAISVPKVSKFSCK